MIGSTRNIRVYAATRPINMSKGIDGLALIVRAELGRDPMSGDLFLFVGRDRRRAKVLYFDGTGMCIFYKRLDKGRFASVWHDDKERQIELTATELTLFIEGSSLVGRYPVSPPAINEKELVIGIRV
jgi:transposase